MKFFGFHIPFTSRETDSSEKNMISVSDMSAYSGQYVQSPWENSIYDGGKFFGGFGPTQIFQLDYWTLRKRSAQLFTENLYARGLIRRLVTNEINTGLTPEATPDETILGLSEDELNEWSENVENRFNIWAKNPKLCDYHQKSTFGDIQRTARREALIEGDILIILRQSRVYKLPTIQLVKGGSVRTPILSNNIRVRNGHKIVHGVELDKSGRQVAFWVQQPDASYKRIAAFGEKSGRRIAWLVYGTDKRMDDVRGQPLLSIVLQSLKEIDRYRDSAQRKAVINSILAMFIKKTENKPGTLPITGGAVRRDSVEITDSDGDLRKYNIAQQIPGLVIEELQQGEEPVLKGGDGTDVNFGTFEEAIIQGVAWANEIPPEIQRLSFSNNYSASQAAINEFKIYLNLIWSRKGEEFCTPIQIEWLLSEVLLGKIQAQGLLESWRNPEQYDIFGAWTSVEWYGSIKPSTDMLKQAKGSKMLVDEGWSTNARESRITTGTKFTQNIKRLKRENELKVQAMRPIAEFKQEFGDDVEIEDTTSALHEIETNILEAIEDKAS